MTMEDHLRLLIGDLMFRVAQLAAENDTLKAYVPPDVLKVLLPPAPPEPPKPETPHA